MVVWQPVDSDATDVKLGFVRWNSSVCESEAEVMDRGSFHPPNWCAKALLRGLSFAFWERSKVERGLWRFGGNGGGGLGCP